MALFVIRRLTTLVPVLIGTCVVTFILVRIIPGNAVDVALFENFSASTAERNRMEAALGLNHSLASQFWTYVRDLAHGNLGTSFSDGRPVLTDIAERIPATAELAVVAMLLALVIGVAIGVLAAAHPQGIADKLCRALSYSGLAMPSFWLGLLLILVFSVRLRWLPSGGYESFSSSPIGNIERLAMPAIALAAGEAALVMRMTKASMLDALGREYVRTAQGKGVSRWAVLLRHALRNALVPTITVVGIEFGHLLGGVLVIEQVFDWPGLGQLTVTAITRRDYPVIQGVVLLAAAAFLVVNLLVDLSYGFLNPQLKATSR